MELLLAVQELSGLEQGMSYAHALRRIYRAECDKLSMVRAPLIPLPKKHIVVIGGSAILSMSVLTAALVLAAAFTAKKVYDLVQEYRKSRSLQDWAKNNMKTLVIGAIVTAGLVGFQNKLAAKLVQYYLKLQVPIFQSILED